MDESEDSEDTDGAADAGDAGDAGDASGAEDVRHAHSVVSSHCVQWGSVCAAAGGAVRGVDDGLCDAML